MEHKGIFECRQSTRVNVFEQNSNNTWYWFRRLHTNVQRCYENAVNLTADSSSGIKSWGGALSYAGRPLYALFMRINWIDRAKDFVVSLKRVPTSAIRVPLANVWRPCHCYLRKLNTHRIGDALKGRYVLGWLLSPWIPRAIHLMCEPYDALEALTIGQRNK